MKIIIVCTDLLFSTKITGTAKALGQPFGVARTLERLGVLLGEVEPGGVVIVDLNSSGVDVVEAIRVAKAAEKKPRVVAFVSHVQVDLATAAREAGADRVMARSAFVNELPAIVGGG